MSDKKRPPSSSPSAFQIRKDYDYDGVTVADLLSYYLPEWEFPTGRSLLICSGTTQANLDFEIYLTVDKSLVVKAFIKSGTYEVDKILNINSSKSLFFELLDDCIILKDRTDTRIKILIKDRLLRKKIDE